MFIFFILRDLKEKQTTYTDGLPKHKLFINSLQNHFFPINVTHLSPPVCLHTHMRLQSKHHIHMSLHRYYVPFRCDICRHILLPTAPCTPYTRHKTYFLSLIFLQHALTGYHSQSPQIALSSSSSFPEPRCSSSLVISS